MNIEYIKLCKFIEDNKELKNYIERLLSTVKYKDIDNNKIILDNLQELGDKYIQAESEIEKTREELESLGMTFTEDTMFYPEGHIPEYEEDSNDALRNYGHYSFNHNDEYCCYHDHEWLNEDRVGYPTSINGIEISKEILEDERVNHTSKKEYEKWLNEHSNLNEELNELAKEINKDLELLDKKIFGKTKLDKKIKANKEKLLRLNNIKLQGDNLKRKCDFFEGLDDRKYDLLNNYLNSIEECNNISKEINNSMRKLHMSSEIELISDVDKLVEEAINYGIVTPEEVEKYDYILMNIDTSNVIVSDDYIKEFNSGYSWHRNRTIDTLVDNYGSKIMKLRMQKEYDNLSKEAEAKVKTKNK